MRRTRLPIIVTFLFILFCFPLTNGHAAEGDLYMVTVDQLNMRIGPSEETAIVAQLTYGNQVSVFAEEDGWGKTFFKGQKVWVSLSFLQPIADKEEKQVEPKVEKKEKKDKNKEKESKTTPVENQKKKMRQGLKPSKLLSYEQEFTTKEKNKKRTPKKRQTTTNQANRATNLSKQSKANKHQKEKQPMKTIRPKPVKLSKHALSIKDSLAGLHIVIDAGHGGKDSGAIQKDVLEKNITLKTAKIVRKQLKEAGAIVTMTRTNDVFISLEERVKISEKVHADAFISIHFDSFSNPHVQGLASHYFSDQPSKHLAASVQHALATQIDMENRGIRHSNLFVLRENSQKAILLELGFLTNPSDWKQIHTEDFQEKVADAVVKGLLHYFKENDSSSLEQMK